MRPWVCALPSWDSLQGTRDGQQNTAPPRTDRGSGNSDPARRLRRVQHKGRGAALSNQGPARNKLRRCTVTLEPSAGTRLAVDIGGTFTDLVLALPNRTLSPKLREK